MSDKPFSSVFPNFVFIPPGSSFYHLNGGLTVKRTEIEWMSIGCIKPYEKNPGRNDGAVEALASSIMEFGFKNPIIAGHTRLNFEV